MDKRFNLRVWDKTENTMYGWVFYNDGEDICAAVPPDELGCRGKRICVKDAILMQCTGLIDKNGADIYEGDILNLSCYSREGGAYERRAKVMYELQINNEHRTCEAGFCLECLSSGEKLSFLSTNKMAVIGNIFENPEPMEDKDD